METIGTGRLVFGCLMEGTPVGLHRGIVDFLRISSTDLRIATGSPSVTFFTVLAMLHQYKPVMGINVFFHRVGFGEWDNANPGRRFRVKHEELHSFWDHIIPGQRTLQVALTIPVPRGSINVMTEWFCEDTHENLVAAVAAMSIGDLS